MLITGWSTDSEQRTVDLRQLHEVGWVARPDGELALALRVADVKVHVTAFPDILRALESLLEVTGSERKAFEATLKQRLVFCTFDHTPHRVFAYASLVKIAFGYPVASASSEEKLREAVKAWAEKLHFARSPQVEAFHPTTTT